MAGIVAGGAFDCGLCRVTAEPLVLMELGVFTGEIAHEMEDREVVHLAPNAAIPFQPAVPEFNPPQVVRVPS